MTAVSQRPVYLIQIGMPRSIRFRYNPVFLPEYLSTILISIPISAIFMTTPLAGGRGAFVANPNLAWAAAFYLMIAGWLLYQTVQHRRKYCPVLFFTNQDQNVWLDAGRGRMPLETISEVQLTLGKFFGRTVRRIRLDNGLGDGIELSDAIFDFNDSKRLLEKLLGQPVPISPHTDLTEMDRITERWAERHTIFPATETLGDIFSRLSWRAVCLLPVAVVDVLINLATILSLSKLHQHALMVYSAPLSLLVSGFVARYLYYYLFTSTTMNKPMGSSVK